MFATKISAKLVPNKLRGEYKGRKFRVKVCESVTIPADANLWAGGSREKYWAIRLEDGAQVTLGSTSAPWDAHRQDRAVKLVPGIAVVMHSFFQGQDMGLTYYLHPENAGKFLPAS